MAKKTKVKGYRSLHDFETDTEGITDLSNIEDANKLTEVLYKISGLYVKCADGYYLTGDLYTTLLNKLQNHIKNVKNINDIRYLDGTYYNYINKILNGDFEINFKDYSYTYEIENNVEMKRTTIDQILSLRKSLKQPKNELYKDDGKEDNFSDLKEIEDELHLITDLSDIKQRNLLKKIIYKIIRLYGYKLVLSTEVFESINIIISNFKDNVKNTEYYSKTNNDRTYIEKIISSLLDNNYPLMISTTLSSYYSFGLDEIESDIDTKACQLSFQDLFKLNESGKTYKHTIIKDKNKVYVNSKGKC